MRDDSPENCKLAMIMASCLMFKGRTTLENVPQSPIVDLMITALGEVGCTISQDVSDGSEQAHSKLIVEVTETHNNHLSREILHQSPLAYYLIGPQLAMRGSCSFTITDTVPSEVLDTMDTLLKLFGIYNFRVDDEFYINATKPIKPDIYDVSGVGEVPHFMTFTALAVMTSMKGTSYLEGIPVDSTLYSILNYFKKTGLRVYLTEDQGAVAVKTPFIPKSVLEVVIDLATL